MKDKARIALWSVYKAVRWAGRTAKRGAEGALREALCAYYALISLIDEQVGKIVQTLDQRGLRENTIVIFCADHGDFSGGWILRVGLIETFLRLI